jgi:hypothetical protein
MATLSIKHFPDDVLVLLKIKAAQERTTQRGVVIHALGNRPGAPSSPDAPKTRQSAVKNFTLYAANTGENITDAVISGPMKKALGQFQAVLVEFDRSMIVAKLRKGRERTKARVGRCEGGKPFGFYADEAPTLAYIRRLRSEGMQYRHIADRLGSEGYTARSGGQWRGPVIGKILRRDKVAVDVSMA